MNNKARWVGGKEAFDLILACEGFADWYGFLYIENNDGLINPDEKNEPQV